MQRSYRFTVRLDIGIQLGRSFQTILQEPVRQAIHLRQGQLRLSIFRSPLTS